MSEIRDSTKPSQWNHVPGKQNPADVGSRGLTVAQLKSSDLWWNGPDFLRRASDHCPCLETTELPPDEPELKKVTKESVNVVVGTAAAAGASLVDAALFPH